MCMWHVHGMCMACACAWLGVVQANTSGVAMGKWDAGCVDFLQKQVKHIVVAKPSTSREPAA